MRRTVLAKEWGELDDELDKMANIAYAEELNRLGDDVGPSDALRKQWLAGVAEIDANLPAPFPFLSSPSEFEEYSILRTERLIALARRLGVVQQETRGNRAQYCAWAIYHVNYGMRWAEIERLHKYGTSANATADNIRKRVGEARAALGI